MKGDRLLAIVLLLQNRGKLSAQELADRLEVSKRTILRDMESLSAAGVPVYAERGPNGGWLLLNDYSTDLTGMKKEELLSLLFGTGVHHRALRDIGYDRHFELAIEKLLAASPESVRRDAQSVRERLHIDGAGWHESREEYPFLEIVQEAVWSERKLRLAYNNTPERIVEPLGLVAKQNAWYVVARSEDGLRSFRVSRVNDAEMLDEGFERPADFDLAAYWRQSTRQFIERLPRYPATVRLQEQAFESFRKRRYVTVLRISNAGNGYVEAEVEFNTEDSACEIMLGFGSSGQVLKPEALVGKIKEELAAMRLLYSEPS
ncbi:helix-turn-helix transcriptional regulator [Paenibacillus thailandensis]|uniref:Helix-turn-helix transcriptional regulator n=1 Tax=Paenibacillus thailandensis TaxID=393250 RepID=A0ABW5QWU1_9BACL